MSLERATLCHRLFSLFRRLCLYIVFISVPQCLWLHRSDWKAGISAETLCETCSFLPPASLRATESDRTIPNPVINVTLMYEQVCQYTCMYNDKDTDLTREGGGDNTRMMDEFDFGGDGGWSVPHNLPDLTGPCTIKRRNASLSQLEFQEEFSHTEPLVLEGISDQTLFREASTKWRLLSDYGQDLITVATANTHSYYKKQMTLCEYVERFVKPQSLGALGNETFYHFGDNDRERWSQLFSLYHLPPFSLPGMEPVLSFGLAGPGTGVPFHIHGPTFAETIFGRKRWFLYPPEDSPEFHPDESTLHWVTHTLPSLPRDQAPLQCTLRPGEVC